MSLLPRASTARHSDAVKRDRTLGTKVTETDYQRAVEAAGDRSPSEWVRAVVLQHLDRRPIEDALLAELQANRAELIALRITVMNFYRAAVAGESLTYDVAKQHVDAANRAAKGLIAQVPF